MFVVISPAKKLSTESCLQSVSHRYAPVFQKNANELAENMKKYSQHDLQNMMNISESLATLNFERFQRFSGGKRKEQTISAIAMFQGDTYIGFDAKTIDYKLYDFMQDHLCILSGLYGILRPLDEIEPYRLEMGSRLKKTPPYNLYDYWRPIVTEKWQNWCKKQNFILQCASDEYFSLVKPITEKEKIITPKFKNHKNGILSAPGMFVKRLRGALARYVIYHQCTQERQLHNFSAYGYHFSEYYSKPLQPVFIKEKEAS